MGQAPNSRTGNVFRYVLVGSLAGIRIEKTLRLRVAMQPMSIKVCSTMFQHLCGINRSKFARYKLQVVEGVLKSRRRPTVNNTSVRSYPGKMPMA